MAGGELHTDRTKLTDTEAQQNKWRSAELDAGRLIQQAHKARAHAALLVSEVITHILHICTPASSLLFFSKTTARVFVGVGGFVGV